MGTITVHPMANILQHENNMSDKAGFQVNYEVRNTSLGKGVFVLEDVKQGTLVWRYRKGENVICFNGEDETLAHMEKLGSFGEKLRALCYICTEGYQKGGG